ncbi:MAG: metallopeptidase family protein [Nibricoccus sp.]
MTDSQLIARAQQVVARTQKKLPPELHALAQKLPVSYHDWPSAEILGGEFEDDIMGLFVGEPRGFESGTGNAVPAQIFLFLENIYDEAEGEPSRYDEEVKLTYLHELGHYLGWDEDEVEARGL